MSIDHNRIKVADLEKNLPNKILTTNTSGELEFSDMYNALDCTVEGKALDARQGKVLKDLVDNVNALLTSDNINLNTIQELVDAIETVQNSLNTILVNDLSTGGTTKALTAEMGKSLKELMDALTAVVTNHLTDANAYSSLFNAKEDKAQKGAANGYAPLDATTKLAAQYLNIVNDLVTGGATALLSAEQGKQLKIQLDAVNTLLTSDNINLDTVQEIVDAIETVQLSLSTILVNDLTTGGTTKALTAEMGKTLKGLVDALTMTVNGKISSTVSTVKTITSTNLSTQDAAGFVAYINALGVVLVVAANEMVEYQLSDTGRIFRLLLNGRSFGTGQPAITTANVEDVTLWMQKDLKLSNYPSTRNDGALPTNKVLAPDTNGNLKLYSTPILPAPYLYDLIPDSYLPSTTGNFILKGSFFTPTMTVTIVGQTVNYVTFISDNEVRANVTTGAAEGTFAVTLNNGLSQTFNNRMLITLGTVYKPAPADWINVSSQINIDTEGEGHIGVFNAANLAEWNKQFDYTKNWSIRLTIVVSPLGTPSTFNFDNNTAGVFIRKVSNNANVFNFTRQGTGADRILECDNLGNKLYEGTNNSVLEIRYVGGVIYFYSNNVLKFTSAVSITENLKLALVLNTYDVVGIKYIELA